MVVGVFLAMATYLLFYQVINFDFVNLDTPAYVYNNQHVKTGLNWDSVKWAFTSTEISNWHPVTWLSHMLDMELFGMHSGAHHHTSVILHIGNTILLFLFLNAATGYLWRTALVALLFALHPLHVESVAWVAERKDVLCGFFFFLSLLTYRKYVVAATSRFKWYLATLVCFILGLMAKPMLVTLPFLLLVLDFWPFKRCGPGHHIGRQAVAESSIFRHALIVEKLPMILISFGMCVLIILIQKDSGAVATVTALPWDERLSNAVFAYVLYLRDIFWPLNLCAYYPLTGGGESGLSFIALLLIVLMFVLAFLFRKKYKWALCGWLWFTGMLIPVIGIIQVGAQSRADRYTYLPAIGIFIMLAWVLAELAERSKQARLLMVALSIAGLLAMVAQTNRQIGFWENNEKLYTRALSVTENNGVVHFNLGLALFNKNRFKDAITHFSASLESSPGDAGAFNMIGLSFIRMDKPAQAIPHFHSAINIDADYVDVHLNLASVHRRRGEMDTAIMIYRKALRASPTAPRLHNNLATALVSRCELKAAKRHFKLALHYDPDNQKARNNLRLLAQIENEVKNILLMHRDTLAHASGSQGPEENIVDIIKHVFDTYQVPASSHCLEKMVRTGRIFTDMKEH